MIVLDTHALLWWVSDPQRLSRTAERAIKRARRIGVPAIGCFEFASLVVRGRLAVDRSALEWIDQALGLPRVELLPLTPAIAVRASQLLALPDPTDRMIVATALVESAALVTKDVRIRALAGVATVW